MSTMNISKKDTLNLSLPISVSTPLIVKMENYLIAKMENYQNCDYAGLKERFIKLVTRRAPPIDQLMTHAVKRQTYGLDIVEFHGIFQGSTLVLRAVGPTTGGIPFNTAYTMAELMMVIKNCLFDLESSKDWRGAISRGIKNRPVQ